MHDCTPSEINNDTINCRFSRKQRKVQTYLAPQILNLHGELPKYIVNTVHNNIY